MLGRLLARRTAPVLRICYGHQARLVHHLRRLRRQMCVFPPRAASALRLLLGSSVGIASDASRPSADIHCPELPDRKQLFA